MSNKIPKGIVTSTNCAFAKLPETFVLRPSPQPVNIMMNVWVCKSRVATLLGYLEKSSENGIKSVSILHIA